MTDYSGLIARVRSPYALTERDAQEIADALEAQAKEIERLEEVNVFCRSAFSSSQERIAELEAALKNCADELEVWIDELYSVGSVLPEHKLRYKRNIESVRTARAALAVAEPVIREECARIATAIREANADTGFEKSDFLDGIVFGAKMIAAAIREGGNEDGKNN